MATLTRRLARRVRAFGRRIAERVAPTVMESISAVPRLRSALRRLGMQVTAVQQRIVDYQASIAGLRDEIQELRGLHQRVAELTDLVAEVLVPAADRDDERIKLALDDFYRTSF